ncbi:MAG: GH92 family glycosyl hydrolase [Bacteroidota bacterium]|nr:GH92 family glycosyl hydrolase [Bacteroidota bacterium]
MKFYFLPIIILTAFYLSGCGNEKAIPYVPFSWNVDSSKYDFTKYVNPMIGTAGHGHTFPGATAPFGMVQLSPDTRVDGSWDGCSGYHYDDDTIYGFSHTHLSGTGCSDYGDIMFMPGNGKIEFNNGADGKAGYSSGFSHANEKAAAGYYSVVLDNSKTKVELTASPRVGMHRYTFSKKDENWMVIDLKHRDEVLDSKIEIVNDHAIQGYRTSKAWATEQKVYFYAEFSSEIDLTTFSQGSKDQEEKQMIMSGKDVRLALSFKNPENEPLIIKVAISPVSSENAKLNMEVEVPDFDFDAVHKKVVQQWNNELGKIEVRGNDETKNKIFYSALYHCFIAPNIYCDVNGDYMGMDKKVHRDTIHPQYSVFSLWDTYRALHPLFTIIQPKRDQDFINTFVKQYKEGGKLPVWELSANETNCMIGYHSAPVIVDAWMKGLTDFDTAMAYEAMKASAMQNTNGLEAYKKFGFIPAEGESESVSKTLEYAYDDWCIALAAKRMKKEDDYTYFLHRSQSWRNLYDSETGFFRARLNNSFVEPFDPNEVNFHFTEANAWQYSLAVQQDIPGLIAAHGGNKSFLSHLDKLFSVSSKTSGREQADITGLIGQYAQGNEPSHHMAYLYCYAGVPLLTQKNILDISNLYTDFPDGLCGNEDCGQMSAWYVLSAMGFYQVTPGSVQYVIGTPLFDEINLHLENGKTTVIKAPRQANSNFVVGTKVNGENRKAGWLDFFEIANGSTIEFTMRNNPMSLVETHFQGVENAYAEDNRFTTPFPYTAPAFQMNWKDIAMIPDVPRITNFSGRTFTNEVSLKLSSQTRSTVYYTLNGGEPTKYGGSIIIKENATLQCWAVRDIFINKISEISHIVRGSDTVVAYFTKSPDYKSITLTNKYANQYSAGGNRALIDGIRGSDNFRTGDWQGYEGTDLDVVVDLGSVKEINHLCIGFLEDEGAWIFFPSLVTFYSSVDGKTFTEIETDVNTYTRNTGQVFHDDFCCKKIKTRYVRILAKNGGPCPAWHPGNGNKSWLFADEIVIETK